MKRFLILVFVASFGVLYAQPGKVYTSLSEVNDPNAVYSLKLTYKRLKAVPPEIRQMKNLQQLDLSKNFIDSIPSWIGELSQLKSLDVSRNWIHFLPETVEQLSSLELLDASRNPLEELPVTIAKLASLKQLVLWKTGIYELPPSIVMLNGSLKVIDLRACPLTLEDQELISDLLPDVKKVWDQACNCSH